MKAWSDFWQNIVQKWQKFFNRNKSKATYFAHIPKTAGTSFIVLLDRFFDAEEIFPHQLWREAKSINLTENQKYSLFRGHFGGGGVKVLTTRSLDYFTILRSPHELALSTYHFVQREPNTKVHQLVKQNDMSFADFLQHPMTVPLVQNRMVRNISFDFQDDPAAQEVFLSAETIEYLQTIINKQTKAINDDERLSRAKSFIQQCRWFGLLEQFDLSLQWLCFVMYWPPMGETQKLNTFDKKSDLTESELAVLEEVNQQDNELYQFAKKLFNDQIKKMNEALELYRTTDDQSIDDLLDQSYQHHYTEKLKNRLSDGVSYRFDQVLLGRQWHRRELMHPENEYFRWTGPGIEALIDFWLLPQSYEIKIRIINATSIDTLDQLKISLNGHQIDWHTKDQGLVRVLKLNCPAEWILQNGLARLEIRCEEMISHQQAFKSDDERLVGVAVHWIEFVHVN